MVKPLRVHSDFAWLASRARGWQFGETGILSAVADRVCPGSADGVARFVIEYGAGAQHQSDELADKGWKRFLYEADAAVCQYPSNRGNVIHRRVDSPLDLEGTPDVLIIDIDGADAYHAVEAKELRPPVMMVEHHDEYDESVDHDTYAPTREETADKPGEYCNQVSGGVLERWMLPEYVLVASTRINSIFVRADLADKCREAIEVPPPELRLNIGGGKHDIAGYVNVDRMYGREAYPLAYPDSCVEEIRASHVIEHFDGETAQKFLRECFRVLKPGGRLRVATPDIEKIAKALADGEPGNWAGYLYGGQTNRDDYHKCCFNLQGLAWSMTQAGFICCQEWKDDGVGDCARLPVSLNVEGFKPTQSTSDAAIKRKIVAVMSMPRLGWTANFVGMQETIRRLNMDLITADGVFWGQCLTRNIETAIERGAEWILTCDYDTVFNARHVARLAMLMDMYPDADCIAPVQARRGPANVLASVDQSNLTKNWSIKPIVPALTAHFGLTLFRAAAFAKVPKPWFLPKPDQNGGWGDGRVDEDMTFWQKWRECGNTMYLAPGVGIGHLEVVVSWVTTGLDKFYQGMDDYQDNGAPANCRA